jgi:hypothetical protein
VTAACGALVTGRALAGHCQRSASATHLVTAIEGSLHSHMLAPLRKLSPPPSPAFQVRTQTPVSPLAALQTHLYLYEKVTTGWRGPQSPCDLLSGPQDICTTVEGVMVGSPWYFLSLMCLCLLVTRVTLNKLPGVS